MADNLTFWNVFVAMLSFLGAIIATIVGYIFHRDRDDVTNRQNQQVEKDKLQDQKIDDLEKTLNILNALFDERTSGFKVKLDDHDDLIKDVKTEISVANQSLAKIKGGIESLIQVIIHGGDRRSVKRE